jgi:uncharacterized membrane protein
MAQMIEEIVVWGWVVASLIAVLLALWAIQRAYRVKRETCLDLEAILTKGVANGRVLFARQQEAEARLIFWAHAGIVVHQTLFLLVGLYAMSHPDPNEIPVGTPFLEAVGVPVAMLVAQWIAVGVNICLVLVTYGQEGWLRESSRLSGSQDLRDSRQDSRDIRQDNRDIRQEGRDVRQEGRDVRQDTWDTEERDANDS